MLLIHGNRVYTSVIVEPTSLFSIFSQKDIVQFLWPLECNKTNVTVGDCASNKIFNNLDFWTKINEELNITTDENIPDFQCKFLIGTFFVPTCNKITMAEWHQIECWSQSHYRKVPRWGVSNGARHNWKCFLTYKKSKVFF